MSQYFPKPYEPFGGDINIKINLFNYVTKLDLENATRIDRSKLAAKSDLASLKAEVDKIDVDNLKTVTIDLSKLSSVVKNEIVKKTAYDKLVTKVNNIDTSGFVLKTKYDTDKSDLENKISDADKKIPDTSGLVKKQIIMPKLLKQKVKYLLSVVQLQLLHYVQLTKKRKNVSNLVKKTDYTQKLMKLKRKLLIIMVINILLPQNVIS